MGVTVTGATAVEFLDSVRFLSVAHYESRKPPKIKRPPEATRWRPRG